MSKLSRGDYEQHRNCDVGDTVIATLDDGRTVSGTVTKCPGATVYVAGDSGEMFEFRRLTDSDTGERAILFGLDGKGVRDEQTTDGVNPDGIPMTKESSTLSFDQRVVDFEAEDMEVVLGEDSD